MSAPLRVDSGVTSLIAMRARAALFIAAIVSIASTSACDLGRTGLLGDTSGAPDGSLGPSFDASSGTLDASGDATQGSGGDAAGAGDASDAGPILDATAYDACPLPANDGGTVAYASKATPTIDGDLSEWSCASWIAVDESNAMYVKDAGHAMSGIFAAAYDSGHLYVAYHVVDPDITGNSLVDSYVNDSVEVYVSGDTSPTGDYDTESHHYSSITTRSSWTTARRRTSRRCRSSRGPRA